MAKIETRDQLEAWLKGKPREVAVMIASRCALRVLPRLSGLLHVEMKDADPADALLLPLFHANATSWLAGNWLSQEVAAATDSAAYSAFAAADSAAAYSPFVSADAAATAAAASASAATFAAYSAAAAAADNSDDILWMEISSDVRAYEADANALDIGTRPLWSAGLPESLREEWAAFSTDLLARDPNWRVWVDWYNDRLTGREDGRKILPALERDRVLSISPDDLEEGAAHVNAILAALEDKYRGGPTPFQDPTAARFADDGARITADLFRNADEIATDPISTDLHAEALRMARRLSGVAEQLGTAGSNRPSDLQEVTDAVVEALGAEPAEVRPGLLAIRALDLDHKIVEDESRKTDTHAMEEPLDPEPRRALEVAAGAVRMYLQTDPFLAALYARHREPSDANFETATAELIVDDAVFEDAATSEARDIVVATHATKDSQFSLRSYLNFGRAGLKLTIQALAVAGASATGLPKAANWLVKNETAIIKWYENDPETQKMAGQVINRVKAWTIDVNLYALPEPDAGSDDD